MVLSDVVSGHGTESSVYFLCTCPSSFLDAICNSRLFLRASLEASRVFLTIFLFYFNYFLCSHIKWRFHDIFVHVLLYFLFISFPTMMVRMKMTPRGSCISPQEMNCLERIKKYGPIGRGTTLEMSFVLSKPHTRPSVSLLPVDQNGECSATAAVSCLSAPCHDGNGQTLLKLWANLQLHAFF